MNWIAEHWWQVALVVVSILALRELASLRQAAEEIQSMMGSLRDVKADHERGRARREEFGGVTPQSEKR